MRSDREARIRERAYQIWVAEGRTHGSQEEHWHRAEREIAAEDAAPAGKRPARARARAAAAAAVKPTSARKSATSTSGPMAKTTSPTAPRRARQRRPAESGQ
jgi:hypothetical protein